MAHVTTADLDVLFSLVARQGVAVAVLRDERIVLANEAAAALGDDAALVSLARRTIAGEGGPGEGPVPAHSIDGRSLEVRAAQTADGALVLVARDVEEREEALRRLARSDEILRIGAHELRNPLHVVGMICHLLETRARRGEPLDTATLERLRRQVDRSNRLITQLLELSRVQENRLEIDFAEADLAELVRAELAGVGARRAADVHADVVALAPVRADDRGRLAEVVHQLVDNAVRFTDQGTPIDVRLRDAGGDWELVVADQGPGIPPDERATLFERGAKIEARRGPQGLGLGLYIARHVVRLLHGTLRFEPTVPTGATFLLRLPKRV